MVMYWNTTTCGSDVPFCISFYQYRWPDDEGFIVDHVGVQVAGPVPKAECVDCAH